jgi:uncharacterized membrane protein
MFEPQPASLTERILTVAAQARQSGRASLYASIAVSSLASCGMLAFRLLYFDSHAYAFLGWNLMLATIPFVVSQWLVLTPNRSNSSLIAAGLFWLLFFPNAPYLVTDLMHISRNQPPVPIWYDLILLLWFAWNGVTLGFLSLLDLHAIIERRLNARAAWLFAGGAIMLGSFGIYVGRYLRWNSWNVFTSPTAVLTDVVSRLAHPLEYPEAYGVTVFFSAFLFLGYAVLRSLVRAGLPAFPPPEAPLYS